MNIYLVWEYQSHCDYDVIEVFLDKSKAERFMDNIKTNEDYYPHYGIEEKKAK